MNKPMTPSEQRGMILNFFEDFAENDKLLEYMEHVGFEIESVTAEKELPDAIAGHYRIKNGEYDIDRAALDFMTWPPIARAIFARIPQKSKV